MNRLLRTGTLLTAICCGPATARAENCLAIAGSRPLCPYPGRARWTGDGSPEAASNDVCEDAGREEAY